MNKLSGHGFRFRIKWSADEKKTDWQPWIIIPVAGYMETATLGPVKVSEVDFLDVSIIDCNGEKQCEQITKLLKEIDANFSVLTDSIRITL